MWLADGQCNERIHARLDIPSERPAEQVYLLKRYQTLAVVLLVVFVHGCASRPYQPGGLESVALWARAVTEVQGDVQVTTAVPTREETDAIFSLPLYERGVQPVWLQIRNYSPHPLRLALVSLDRDYFSPMEVAYVHRKGYSAEGRAAMEKFLHAQGIARFIAPGATSSGFVFTHLDPGTKGFNVDIYGNRRDYIFTFFIAVPGFVPDHAEVDFASLYADGEFIQLNSENELRQRLAEIPCCSVNTDGKQGDPINLAVVADPKIVGRVLLQSRWEETAAGTEQTAAARTHRYLGRPPDAVFHKSRKDGSERKELRLWMAPMLLGDSPVWLGQISHDIRGDGGNTAAIPYRIDPDLDDARMYLLQNFWFSQSLLRFGFVNSGTATPIDAQAVNFLGSEYFTDGYVLVLMLSGRPVGLDEVQRLQWDTPPRL
jgi:hypothetical protein